MQVYRIVHSIGRTADLSGTGAYHYGGRWNSKGIYMLYTSANSSLAMLETLVNLDISVLPAHLYVMQIHIDDSAPVFEVPDTDYPADWKESGTVSTKAMGDQWMRDAGYLSIKVRSAVNEMEYNMLLNPLFTGYANLVKVEAFREIRLDGRLMN